MSEPLYDLVERNAGLGTAHFIGKARTWAEAVATAQARMPDPAQFRRFYWIEARPVVYGPAVELRRGTA